MVLSGNPGAPSMGNRLQRRPPITTLAASQSGAY